MLGEITCHRQPEQDACVELQHSISAQGVWMKMWPWWPSSSASSWPRCRSSSARGKCVARKTTLATRRLSRLFRATAGSAEVGRWDRSAHPDFSGSLRSTAQTEPLEAHRTFARLRSERWLFNLSLRYKGSSIKWPPAFSCCKLEHGQGRDDSPRCQARRYALRSGAISKLRMRLVGHRHSALQQCRCQRSWRPPATSAGWVKARQLNSHVE